MISADEILELSRTELARWLVTNPRVFAGNVIIITHDAVSDSIRLFAGDLPGTIASLRKQGAEINETGVAERMGATTSPVIVVTSDGSLWLETLDWGKALAG